MANYITVCTFQIHVPVIDRKSVYNIDCFLFSFAACANDPGGERTEDIIKKITLRIMIMTNKTLERASA